jgi:dTMP kinase
MSGKGRFISVEGGEGVGKTTQLAVIQSAIKSAGFEAVMTREPGGTPRAEKIRELLLTPTAEPMPQTCELLLMFAARCTHLENVIQPALERGAWVVSDRFTDATYAYQGGARGMSRADIALLEQLVQGTLRPDLTLLLDAPVEQALERARRRNEGQQTDRFELERTVFFERVRATYLERAASEPRRFRVIDASQPLDVVTDAVRSAIRLFVETGRNG